uniref:Uncharacterized protein n=1 Tax=Mycena chlorophos TaxID=658473 RepID=A0ABQ0MD38_MYCCL|nr:predicted protein [Mycena chlorophos]
MCLVWLEDPYITVLWQLFPLWQFLAQSAHLLVRKPNRNESGFTWIQALYVGVFMVASSTHISTLAKGDLKAIFVPSLEPRVGVAPELQVLDLLQWDGIFAFVSSLLGTIWFGRTTTEAACILLWNVLGTVVVGPGAALAAVALWRESHLYST